MDRILASWLERQRSDLDNFAVQTDLVHVTPVGEEAPCRKYVAEFRCRGLVRNSDGSISETDHFAIGIYFGDDHLRKVEPMELVWLLSPLNIWHPNIRPPLFCMGHLRAGTGLVDILYQAHSILSYQNVSPGDYLNPDAAAWAREHRDRFPIDRRPLKRREFQMTVQEVRNNDLDVSTP